MRATARALILVLALAMTGCLKLDMQLELSPDDTASGTTTFALDRDLVRLSGSTFDQLTGGETPLPSGVDVTSSDYEDGQFVGKTYAFRDVPIERISDPTSADSLQIRREDDTFVVDGALDLTTEALQGGEGSQLGQSALESAQVRIAITFPGEVRSATGQVDGRTVIWTPKVGERTRISAVGSAIATGGANIALWVAIAVLAAVAIVAGAMLLLRRTRRPPESPIPGFSGAPSTPLPSTPMPGGPTPGAPPPSTQGGVPSAPAPEQPTPPSRAPDQPVEGPVPEQPVEPHRPVAPPGTAGDRPED